MVGGPDEGRQGYMPNQLQVEAAEELRDCDGGAGDIKIEVIPEPRGNKQ